MNIFSSSFIVKTFARNTKTHPARKPAHEIDQLTQRIKQQEEEILHLRLAQFDASRIRIHTLWQQQQYYHNIFLPP